VRHAYWPSLSCGSAIVDNFSTQHDRVTIVPTVAQTDAIRVVRYGESALPKHAPELYVALHGRRSRTSGWTTLCQRSRGCWAARGRWRGGARADEDCSNSCRRGDGVVTGGGMNDLTMNAAKIRSVRKEDKTDVNGKAGDNGNDEGSKL
jgi:hypothetical protein